MEKNIIEKNINCNDKTRSPATDKKATTVSGEQAKIEQQTPAVNFSNIPPELKSSSRFCVWKKERGERGRLTKIPYNPAVPTQKAQTNTPATFSDFRTAAATYAVGGFDGLGIRVANVPGESYGIGAIDIDNCFREDGSLNDTAADVLDIFKDSYAERSPSGNGLRAFFKIDQDFAFDKTVYYINNHRYGLEIYIPGTTNRFVTVTGNVYRAGDTEHGNQVPLDPAALQTCLDTYMKRASKVTQNHIEPHSYLTDESVLEHARNAQNGERFMDYYNGDWQKYFDNQSDADMGFLSMLAFWCGCDEEQMDRIYRSSGMMRAKWDRKQAGTTYGAITIRNAVSTCKSIYLPVNAQDIVDARFEFDNLDASSNTDDNENNTNSESQEKADFEADLSRITLTIKDMAPHTNPRYGRDEIGIGYAFADYFKPIARYNAERKQWYIYDGSIASMKNNIEDINKWLYHRIRMCIWKQWKKPKTKVRNLLKMGVPEDLAWKAGNSRRGYWFTTQTVAINMAMTKERLISSGFYDLATAYQSVHVNY